MIQKMIHVAPRAYAALLASCSRTVLAQDAAPILASDIEPLLRGGFRRHEIVRALASKLKGRLGSDTANPEDVASKLVGMLHEPEKETTMNTSQVRSPTRRKAARDGLNAELQKMLRSKLDGKEFEAVMSAIGGGNSSEDEPREDSEYSRQQFSAAPPRSPADESLDDIGDNAGIAKRGEFDKDNGDLSEKIMALCGPHLADEDRDGLRELLDNVLGGEDATAQDDPPQFSGQPMVGGKLRPLSAKCDTAQDAKVVRYQSKARDEARQAFDARFPEVARLGLGEPQQQYRDGMPVHDPRLLSGSTPTARRMAAMDSAASVRSAKSFAERCPEAARIKVV